MANGVEKFYVETVRGGPTIDQNYVTATTSIFEQTFRPVFRRVLGDKNKAEQTITKVGGIMRSLYIEPSLRLFLLRSRETDEIAGFSSSYPISLLNENPLAEHERETLGLTPDGYTALQKGTVTLGNTIITPQNRGQRGWTLMMDELDRDVAEQGKFLHTVRTVRVGGKYADKVKRRYGKDGNLLYENTYKGIYGPMRYFRFKI